MIRQPVHPDAYGKHAGYRNQPTQPPQSSVEDWLGSVPEWVCDWPTLHHWDTCPNCLTNKSRLHLVKGNSMSDELNFDDLAPAEMRFKWRGKSFICREASEGSAVQWRNANSKGLKFGPDGKVAGLGEGASDSEPLLVSLCVVEKGTNSQTGNDTFSAVPIQVVRGWPARVVRPVYDWIIKASGLRETETPERKALLAALSREDSPIALGEFQQWVEKLKEGDEKTFGPLHTLISPDPSNPLTNGESGRSTTNPTTKQPSDTTVSST